MENGKGEAGVPIASPLPWSTSLPHLVVNCGPALDLPWTPSTQEELALELEVAASEGRSWTGPGQQAWPGRTYCLSRVFGGNVMLGRKQTPAEALLPTPHSVSPPATPPHQRPGPFVTSSPRVFLCETFSLTLWHQNPQRMD